MQLGHRRIGIAMLAVVGVAGCSGVPDSLKPGLPNFPTENATSVTNAIASNGNAIAVISAGVTDLSCADARLILAKPSGAGYATVKEVLFDTTYADQPSIAAVELPPGTYAVTHFSCRNGSNITFVGRGLDAAPLPWAAQSWPAAIASLTIPLQGVADLGRLEIMPARASGLKKPKDRAATLTVTALPADALAKLQATRPDLAGRLAAAPMLLGPAPDGAPWQVEKCSVEYAKAPPLTDGSKPKKKSKTVAIALGETGPPVACGKAGGTSEKLEQAVKQQGT
jgi:hypothetical protein